MIQSSPGYDATESDSLGWPAYLFIIAFSWLACYIFMRPPWSYGVSVVCTAAVLALAAWLRRSHLAVSVIGSVLTRDNGREVEVYELSALANAAYHWIPYYGPVIDIEWGDGRVLEIPVVWRTRSFRSALRVAISEAKPPAIIKNPESMRSLRRAGLA